VNALLEPYARNVDNYDRTDPVFVGTVPTGVFLLPGLDRDPQQSCGNCPSVFFEILTIHFHPTVIITPPVKINIKQ
jgi:hypothetical protein